MDDLFDYREARQRSGMTRAAPRLELQPIPQ
jgi:hypothetical protein